LLSTRSKKRIYRFEMSDADHRRLLAALVRCRCGVVVSGYWSRMYAAALAGWGFETRKVITRGGVLRDECLWWNTPAADVWTVRYSDLGADYRERERVARKVRRWAARLVALPARERDAVLRAVIDAGGRTRRE
jgi:DNA adenine methylase